MVCMGRGGFIHGIRRVFMGGLLGGMFVGAACGGRAHGGTTPSVMGQAGASGTSTAGNVAGMQTAGASGEMDAGSCDDQEQAAQAAFKQVLSANGSCQTDADCTRAAAGADCVAVCGVKVSKAAVAAVQAAAMALCKKFDSRGCVPPSMSCPPRGVVLCQAGQCTEV